MKQAVLLKSTADGSHTLYVPALDEHYHSTNGAIQESMHIFIGAGLNACNKGEIAILEIGFGTGLNAYLTLANVKVDTKIYYHSFELYPLPYETIKQLNYSKTIAPITDLFYELHNVDWDRDTSITSNFELRKIHADFSQLSYPFDRKYDLIFFDAFAPDKQAEMWSQYIFDKLFEQTNKGGALVTYCAKGSVRRMLQQAGYTVERLAGPPGKREMLRATSPH